MKIRYIRDITSPGKLSGKKGEEKDLPERVAKGLIAQGYAEKTTTKKASN